MTDDVEGPRYDLSLAKSLIAEGEYDYDSGDSCWRSILAYVPELTRAVSFIAEVFCHVSAGDFCNTVPIARQAIEGTYDEYVLALPEDVAATFRVSKRNWYLKFKITERRGQKLFVLSLHPLRHAERRRRAGPLDPD